MKNRYQKPVAEIVDIQVVDAVMAIGDKEYSDGWEWDDE